VCAEPKAVNAAGLRVISCNLADLPEIEQILRVSPEASAWSLEALSDALRHHARYFFVARNEQGIAAFICGRKVAEEGEILNLAVRPGLRKRGMGKALAGKLLHAFAQDGVAQVFLEVRESNAPAISFYRQLGFHQIGHRPSYYQNPPEAALVLMRKPAS
jgi:[ribosomal protein S18]-alanine N-acetyltransferase